MPKDYTQRRNERWETVFPGIGLESILGRDSPYRALS